MSRAFPKLRGRWRRVQGGDTDVSSAAAAVGDLKCRARGVQSYCQFGIDGVDRVKNLLQRSWRCEIRRGRCSIRKSDLQVRFVA